MSKRVGNTIIIEREDDDKCEFCGKVDELRPYGPNRERICFECGMKDEATTQRIMARDLFGQGETH
jgi:hypothetical protein